MKTYIIILLILLCGYIAYMAYRYCRQNHNRKNKPQSESNFVETISEIINDLVDWAD